jgi:cysteine desulfurase
VLAYLDHAATTPVRPEARDAVLTAPLGNPSSLHTSGRAARRVLEEARESIAEDLELQPDAIVFTSGGTMADNLGVIGTARGSRANDTNRNLVVISAIEHHAVLDAAQSLVGEGFELVQLPVDADCQLQVEVLAELLEADAARVAVLSVMSANNEIGAAQPIAQIADLAANYEVPLHIDAVQSIGWWGMPAAPAAAVSISGHKFGAPIGIGALVLPHESPMVPLVHGGGQERKLHSGTLDAAGAAAMAAALRASLTSQQASGEPGVSIADLRHQLVAAVTDGVPTARVLTPDEGSLPGITSVLFDGCDADALLMLLDAQGVECSTGSACTAGIPEPSHVVMAMGFDEVQARSVLRFSLGWTSTRADIDALAAALPNAVERAQRASSRSRRQAS